MYDVLSVDSSKDIGKPFGAFAFPSHDTVKNNEPFSFHNPKRRGEQHIYISLVVAIFYRKKMPRVVFFASHVDEPRSQKRCLGDKGVLFSGVSCCSVHGICRLDYPSTSVVQEISLSTKEHSMYGSRCWNSGTNISGAPIFLMGTVGQSKWLAFRLIGSW